MRRIGFTNTKVASSETARDINRGVVLNLIRRRQPISRADLARVSGLQRSTVSLITEQLIQEEWVINGPPGRLPRGRRPTFLRLNERRAILVADLRPELTTLAVADVNGRFLSQEGMPTPANPRATVNKLAARIRHLAQVHRDLLFEGIGISLPGRFDSATQRVLFAPNLKWPEFDFKGAMERATGMRVELENAANACVLAEVWFAHAESIRDMVVVTVSEGVGTGVLMNGELALGLHGMAGEFGHVSINPEGPVCTCGNRGCWELYASNRAALRYYHESKSAPPPPHAQKQKPRMLGTPAPPPHHAQERRVPGTPAAVGPGFQDLLSLAEAGDVLAVQSLDRMAHALGRGMRMIMAALAPEEIVVVGELSRQWHRFGPVIEGELAAGVLVGKPPRVRPAEGSMARLRGTVALVLQKHFDPAALGSEEGSPAVQTKKRSSVTGS